MNIKIKNNKFVGLHSCIIYAVFLTIAHVCNLHAQGMCSIVPNGNQNGGMGKPCSIQGGEDGLSWTVRVFTSGDPNDITGPRGFGEERFLARKDDIFYTIRYENDPKIADAPAFNVYVTYPIDTNQNIFAFRLADFGFNGFVFQVPPNSLTYSNRLDMTDSMGVFVDVIAGIDIIQREAFWHLTTIDPATGLPPADPFKGFLPVRDTLIADSSGISQYGTGYVNFTIKPRNTTVTGDTMWAQASIVFDINEPVITNIEKHTIDAVAPTSTVLPISPSLSSTAINLQFTGVDDAGGVGLENYDLYVSEDSGYFFLHQAAISDSVFSFTGKPGSSYSFFTLARDSVGNVEALKTAGSASTVVQDTTNSTFTLKLFLEGFYTGNNLMRAVLYNRNHSIDPTVTDSIMVEFHSFDNHLNIAYSTKSILHKTGTSNVYYPSALNGNDYYIVIRHRNSIETWSKTPVRLGEDNYYDFTSY